MRVPASKSVANRELVLSALARGRSRLEVGHMDPGADVHARTEGRPEQVGAYPNSADGKPQRMPAIPSMTPTPISGQAISPPTIPWASEAIRPACGAGSLGSAMVSLRF